MKIGIASTDWSRTVFDQNGPLPGGANYIRLQQWRKHSKHQTVTGLLVSHYENGFGVIDATGTTHYDIDVVVLQRLMHRQLLETLDKDKNRSKPVINDIDDWYWGLHHENHAHKILENNKDSDETVDNYREIIKQSDFVVASTPFLQQKMIFEFGCAPGHVQLLENCVDTLSFNVRPISTKKPIVGWVGSTAHRSGDLAVVKDVFDDGFYRLHHTGASPGHPTMAEKMGVDGSRITTSPMVAPQLYGQKAFVFDIGIAPLNDIPFNHAKSWIKAIEYAAAGVPFIASDLPEYRRLKENYGIGRLAATTEEWKQHLVELRSADSRAQESRHNLQIVREMLDVKRMAKEWDSVFERFS